MSIEKCLVRKAKEMITTDTPFGTLTWISKGDINNSDNLSIGRLVLHPGKEIPRHSHPVAEEVIHILEGNVIFTDGDNNEIPMTKGDTATAPVKQKHTTRNETDSNAVLSITFSSANHIMDLV